MGGTPDAGEPVVAVIVHPSRTDTPSLREIGRIYLRQQRFWSDRDPILPVNRDYGSRVRRRFEQRVFGDATATLARHWDELYFQGVLPPPVLASDAAVRDFVAARPDAIGYVDARHVDGSVRIVLRIE